MSYCCNEHQDSDRLDHQPFCDAIQGAADRVRSFEANIRAGNDPEVPAEIFDTHIGYFWRFDGTRPYLKAHFELAQALMKLKTTRKAIVEALVNCLEILRLNRQETFGARDVIPQLMLRLDHDQEAYDFIEWWETEGWDAASHNYYWGDGARGALRYLVIRGVDVWEPVNFMCRKEITLCNCVAMTYLKVKMLLDIKALQNSELVSDKVPEELLLDIREKIPRSPLIRENKEIVLKSVDLKPLEDKLVKQIKMLAEAVTQKNEYIWPAITRPDMNLMVGPPPYLTPGMPSEMQLALKYFYDCWTETPGAIELVNDIRTNQTHEEGTEFPGGF